MKIGFVTTDWSSIPSKDGEHTPGGAGWYRIVMPQRRLRLEGYACWVGMQIGARRDGELVLLSTEGEEISGLDIIVIQRWMESHAAEAIRRARATGQVVINDVDDWFEGLDPSNLAWKTTHPKRNADKNRVHYMKALAASSALTVSTPYLRERYQEKLPNVPIHVIRNAIDLDRWTSQHVDQRKPAVGWVGGVTHRSKDVETVGSVVNSFLKQHPGARFQHGGWVRGWPNAGELMKLDPSIPVITIPMCSIENYPNLFKGINVGLVPLSGSAFNLAKSAIKGMEYAASGIPFIAQSTPEYEWLRTTQGIGFTARRPREWIKLLDRLSDPKERAAAGECNRQHVASLDIGRSWRNWVDTYSHLLTDSA